VSCLRDLAVTIRPIRRRAGPVCPASVHRAFTGNWQLDLLERSKILAKGAALFRYPAGLILVRNGISPVVSAAKRRRVAQGQEVAGGRSGVEGEQRVCVLGHFNPHQCSSSAAGSENAFLEFYGRPSRWSITWRIGAGAEIPHLPGSVRFFFAAAEDAARAALAMVDQFCASVTPGEVEMFDIDDSFCAAHGAQQLAFWNAHHDERGFANMHIC
jgi:hypothetical protein